MAAACQERRRQEDCRACRCRARERPGSCRMTEIPVEILQLPHGAGRPLPHYQTKDAAGCDLAAAVEEANPLVLPPGGRALVPTGIAIALRSGFEAQIRPRSGLAVKFGVTVLNSPGTIDADYR